MNDNEKLKAMAEKMQADAEEIKEVLADVLDGRPTYASLIALMECFTDIVSETAPSLPEAIKFMTSMFNISTSSIVEFYKNGECNWNETLQ